MFHQVFVTAIYFDGCKCNFLGALNILLCCIQYLKMVVMLAHRFIQDIYVFRFCKKNISEYNQNRFSEELPNEVLMSSNHKTCFSFALKCLYRILTLPGSFGMAACNTKFMSAKVLLITQLSFIVTNRVFFI